MPRPEAARKHRCPRGCHGVPGVLGGLRGFMSLLADFLGMEVMMEAGRGPSSRGGASMRA